MRQDRKETLGYVVHGLSIALYFYLASTLDVLHVPLPIRYLAWILLGLGVTLVLVSIATLVGNRGEGLIEGGIYGIVRHPMYLGGIVLFFSWIFFCPHWIVLLISSANIAIVYRTILHGERRNIIKFGDTYGRYMESVPRMNLMAGLVRRLQRK